jgi:hypothetical protein
MPNTQLTKETIMKRIAVLFSLIALVATRSSVASLSLDPSNAHFGWGVGMAFSKIPFLMSNLKLPLSNFYYDRQFTDPNNSIRASAELGLYGFSGIIPVPEIGSNLYIGGEKSPIQGKIGLGGFYDIAVGGHAGIMAKLGAILANRFDLSVFVVPTGTDSKQSYQEFLGLESKASADAYYAQTGHHVAMPYFGFMFTIRH